MLKNKLNQFKEWTQKPAVKRFFTAVAFNLAVTLTVAVLAGAIKWGANETKLFIQSKIDNDEVLDVEVLS